MCFKLLRGALAAVGFAVTCSVALASPALAADKPVTVFAAASLKDVLTKIGADWEAETGKQARFSFAASGALAKQVEQGAPADVFLSADQKWMDYLDKKGLIDAKSRRDLLGNHLVLVGGKDARPIEIGAGLDLAKALGDGRLAVGLTASVPAGIYAKQALERLKLWDQVKDKLAEAENVQAALKLVSRGEAPLGVVYATDAKGDASVKTVGAFPDDSHEPIIYPAAVTKAGTNGDAASFVTYLGSQQATKAFEEAGFVILKN